MKARAIHQLVAGYANGDAISNEARRLRDVFRGWGLESEIYCEANRILPELRKDAWDLSRARQDVTDDCVVLLHLSIGSEVNTLLPELTAGAKVIRYHNVTPSRYYRALNEHIANQLDVGRQHVEMLAGAADLNLAVSRYNASELEALGYPNVQVHPLVLTLKRLDAKPNRAVLERYQDGRLNVLFVGRCAPNKRIEDLLHLHYYLQKYVEPRARLIHVGSFAGTEQYNALLRTMVRDLKLDAVDLVGSVPEDHLCAYYQTSHFFACMSEHEGFGIPLLEAMQAQLPVFAYRSSAVPETMDGAGVNFSEKNFAEVAELIGKVHRDPALRQSILDGQNARLRRYENQDLESQLREHFEPWL